VFVYVNDCDGCLFATTAVVGVVIGMWRHWTASLAHSVLQSC
jgi:hypothetical protein